jgi:hypothetical protein
MDIFHLIAINSEKDIKLYRIINKIGINYKSMELPGAQSHLIVFEIYESDPNWRLISGLIIESAVSNRFDTIFTKEEIHNAEWLRLIPSFEQGYPQPRLYWPIKQLSFDLLCNKCAIYNQIGSMRLAKEPHLGKKTFMSLIATGEIFAKSIFFQSLSNIQARGYEVKSALIHKTGIPSEIVSQLYVPNVTEPGFLSDNDLNRVICPICGTVKYYPHMKGVFMYQRRTIRMDLDFIRTNEWFGSGYISWREILVSNRIARLILDNKWEGVRLKVVELV